MNWDIEIKRIEKEVQASIERTIKETIERFDYCQEERQLQEVLKELSDSLPHYKNKYAQKDFHTLRTKANIETKFIFAANELRLEKIIEYNPDNYAERLCNIDLPEFTKKYTHLSDESIDVEFLRLKYKGENGICLLLENCISCSLHSKFLYGKLFENFLPTSTPPTYTNHLRKHLGLDTLNHGKPSADILKFNIGLNHKTRKAENFFLLFDILYEFQMFKDENDNIPLKQDYFKALDSIFTLPHHQRFSNVIYQAKSKKDQEHIVAIFESMLKKAKEKYLQ